MTDIQEWNQLIVSIQCLIKNKPTNIDGFLQMWFFNIGLELWKILSEFGELINDNQVKELEDLF